MSLTSLLLLVAAALIIGGLIGCIGVGGILLPPALAYIGGLDLHLAMATSVWSFMFSGVAGTISYSRYRNVNWRMGMWLTVGIVPAAVLGARANAALPTSVLTVILAVLIALVGVNALLSKPPTVDRQTQSFGSLTLLAIGVVVGFGSVLTGTGGPVLLIPILVFMQAQVLGAVGASQVVQIPVAIFGTVGFLVYGRVDFFLGTLLGVLLMIGVLGGTYIAHSVPASTLRRVVAVTLVAVGILMIVRNI